MANRFTAAISILIYLITFVISIVEITKAKLLYDATCSMMSCWAIFIVVWALAIPVAFLSIVREIIAIRLSPSRSSSRGGGSHAAPRHRGVLIGSAVVVLGLWLAVLVIGWAPIRLHWTVYYSDSNVDYDGPPPDVTGMFRYVVTLYNEVMPYYHDGPAGQSEDVFVLARAGYGAAIMCTISFAWSFLNAIFEIAGVGGRRSGFTSSKV